MARPSKLAAMSVEALLQLRDDIGNILTQKVGQLQSQLAALGDGGWISFGQEGCRPSPSKQDEGP